MKKIDVNKISENAISDNYKYHVIDSNYNHVLATNLWNDVIASNGSFVVYSKNKRNSMHLRSKIEEL